MTELQDHIRGELGDVFAMLGIVSGLMLWRMEAFAVALEQLRVARSYTRTGNAPRIVDLVARRRRMELFVWWLAFLVTVLLCVQTAHYFVVFDLVSDHKTVMDTGALSVLAAHAEAIRAECVTLAATAGTLLLAGWGLNVLLPSQLIDKEDIPLFSHAFVIPRTWRYSPQALWEARIGIAIAETDSPQEIQLLQRIVATRGWTRSWKEWNACVNQYMRSNARRLSEEQGDRRANLSV